MDARRGVSEDTQRATHREQGDLARVRVRDRDRVRDRVGVS